MLRRRIVLHGTHLEKFYGNASQRLPNAANHAGDIRPRRTSLSRLKRKKSKEG